MCVIRGHAYAGGLIFALCHDFRVMLADSGKLCFSEIHAGVMAFPPAYLSLCKTLLPRQITREMILGRPINSDEGLERGVLSGIFKSEEELM